MKKYEATWPEHFYSSLEKKVKTMAESKRRTQIRSTATFDTELIFSRQGLLQEFMGGGGGGGGMGQRDGTHKHTQNICFIKPHSHYHWGGGAVAPLAPLWSHPC